MPQFLRYSLDRDTQTDALCCKRMAQIVKMPVQSEFLADFFKAVFYRRLGQTSTQFVRENEIEFVIPKPLRAEFGFFLICSYPLQAIHHAFRRCNGTSFAVLRFRKIATVHLFPLP